MNDLTHNLPVPLERPPMRYSGLSVVVARIDAREYDPEKAASSFCGVPIVTSAGG